MCVTDSSPSLSTAVSLPFPPHDGQMSTHHLYAYFLSPSPVLPQVFIGGCSVNAFSGLPMSEFFFLFKSVSTLPDSFLNLHRHIQMLAEQREFVICHQHALISPCSPSGSPSVTVARCTFSRP